MREAYAEVDRRNAACEVMENLARDADLGLI